MADKTMAALLKTARGPGNVEVGLVPIPEVAPDQVLIRVHACGICGSDLKIEVDEHPYSPLVVVGHEFAGVIVEVGHDVGRWAVGDRVVAEQHAHACGHCRYSNAVPLYRQSSLRTPCPLASGSVVLSWPAVAGP
jgi:L-iditol 2-dehydrogenase